MRLNPRLCVIGMMHFLLRRCGLSVAIYGATALDEPRGWVTDAMPIAIDGGASRKRRGRERRKRDERPGNDERRRVAGAGTGVDRHEPCLFCRVGAAPHASPSGRSRGEADPGAFREGGGLYGRRLRPAQRPAGRVHGASGRRRQPRLRPAGSLARPQPGDRADRTQAGIVPAPQCLSGDRPRPALRRGDQVLDAGRCDKRVAAPAAPRLARRAGRSAAPDPSRFRWSPRRYDRAWPDRRAAGHRAGAAPHPGAPAGRRRARPRTRGGARDRRAAGRDRRRRRGCRVGRRRRAARLGRGACRADRHDAGRARHHSDPASPVGRRRRQLFRAARQPHRLRRRSRIVCRLRYRRPGDAELAGPGDRHPDRADRRRSLGNRAQLSAHDRSRRRPEGDPGRLSTASSAARRAIPAMPRRRRGSSRIGGRA